MSGNCYCWCSMILWELRCTPLFYPQKELITRDVEKNETCESESSKKVLSPTMSPCPANPIWNSSPQDFSTLGDSKD